MQDTSGEGRAKARPDSRAIETWLVAYLAGLLQMEPGSIDVRMPFSRFGLSSADSVGLAGDLENWLGENWLGTDRLPATLAWDFPTIELLAQHLGDAAGAKVSEVEESGGLEALLSEIERLPEAEAARLAAYKRAHE